VSCDLKFGDGAAQIRENVEYATINLIGAAAGGREPAFRHTLAKGN
jgi:hypothetical protein